MTVSSTISSVTYAGNDQTVDWSFPFKILSDAELQVWRTDVGGRTSLVSAGYTVDGVNQDAGGSVKYPLSGPPLASGEKLTLRRVVQRVQELDLQNQGGFFPDVIETQFDRVVMMVQEVEEKADRAIKVGISSGLNPDALLDEVYQKAADVRDAEASASESAAAAANSEASAAASAASAANVVQGVMWRDVVYRSTAHSPINLDQSYGGKLVVIDATAGPVTVNLQPIASLPQPWSIGFKKTDGSPNAVTLNRAGTDTVGGAASFTLTAKDEDGILVADTDADPDDWTRIGFGPGIPETVKTQSLIIACSDEVTPIIADTAKVTLRMPYAFRLTAVRASLSTAQASGNIFTVDINESGASILSTKLTIDNTEKTSSTAATPAVISDADLANDAEITIDIDQIGNGTAKGLKVTLIGYIIP